MTPSETVNSESILSCENVQTEVEKLSQMICQHLSVDKEAAEIVIGACVVDFSKQVIGALIDTPKKEFHPQSECWVQNVVHQNAKILIALNTEALAQKTIQSLGVPEELKSQLFIIFLSATADIALQARAAMSGIVFQKRAPNLGVQPPEAYFLGDMR